MSLTADQITAGAAYAVSLDPHALSFKRFADAKRVVKEIGGTYDGTTRTWTVTIPEAGGTQSGACQNCKHGGRDGAFAWQRDENGLCARCHGSETVTWTVQPRTLSDLRALASAYGAVIEHAADTQPVPARTRARRAYGSDFAEYGDGFSPEEREAFGG